MYMAQYWIAQFINGNDTTTYETHYRTLKWLTLQQIKTTETERLIKILEDASNFILLKENNFC